ncbi:MAG: phospholipid carrier-dependent glycosyltransferase [Deltaproteobacteria bacterium]|nr:phospholipid carrier-dependent glycosyltransferase [Deltaproteobacteria bacterium]
MNGRAVRNAVGWLLPPAGLFLRGKPPRVPEPAEPPALGRRDAALLGCLTAVCLAVSLWNLGRWEAPETGWKPSRAGDAVTFEFGREVSLSRIYYYCGINEADGDGSRFTLSTRTTSGRFEPLETFSKEDVGRWKYVEVEAGTSAVRLTADTPGGRLNELAFVAEGSRRPVEGVRIAGARTPPAGQGSPAHLLDEQRCFEYEPTFRTGFYFDEIYFARTAWEMLHGIEPYENTHPPLGKLAIAAGIALFGMNPVGWRIAGTLFGAALVPVMYLLGLKLFRNRFGAFSAAFLLLADFMRFAHTRIALIDAYAIFFILLLYYFLLDLFPGGDRVPEAPRRSILLAGTAFGLGAACKWIAVYAGGGATLLLALRTAADWKRGNFAPGQRPADFLRGRLGVFLVAFVAIPGAIYVASYLPYLALPGPGHDLAGLVAYQRKMLDYHRTLHATHPFSSPWWSWPLDLRPVWLYMGTGLAEGMVSTIASFGNPALWWAAIPAVAGAAVLAVRRRDVRLGVVLTGFAFQYLPWIGIERLAFIYHFFSSVPFVILCLVSLLQAAGERRPALRGATAAYLALTGALFVVFYPVLSGLVVPETYVARLRWLPTWIF